MQLLRKNGQFEIRADSNSLTKCENTSLLGLQSLTKNSFNELYLWQKNAFQGRPWSKQILKIKIQIFEM